MFVSLFASSLAIASLPLFNPFARIDTSVSFSLAKAKCFKSLSSILSSPFNDTGECIKEQDEHTIILSLLILSDIFDNSSKEAFKSFAQMFLPSTTPTDKFLSCGSLSNESISSLLSHLVVSTCIVSTFNE